MAKRRKRFLFLLTDSIGILVLLLWTSIYQGEASKKQEEFRLHKVKEGNRKPTDVPQDRISWPAFILTLMNLPTHYDTELFKYLNISLHLRILLARSFFLDIFY
jgi:hypothetical protein